MINSHSITISKKLYYELMVDSEKLRRLENGGVDNWDWYGDSLNDPEEESLEEFEENLKAGNLEEE